MIPKGLFTQIAMIILSVGIAFSYVSPTFTAIGEKQDSLALYQAELRKVEAVNQKLESLLAKDNGIDPDDRAKLLTYMPDRVDEVAVMRELSFIVEQSGMTLNTIEYELGVQDRSDNLPTVSNVVSMVPHSFKFTVDGTYPQFKDLLTFLSQNHYPLEIQELSVGDAEEGFVSADLTLVTYEIEVAAPSE